MKGHGVIKCTAITGRHDDMTVYGSSLTQYEQPTGWQERPWNDQLCLQWHVQLSPGQSMARRDGEMSVVCSYW